MFPIIGGNVPFHVAVTLGAGIVTLDVTFTLACGNDVGTAITSYAADVEDATGTDTAGYKGLEEAFTDGDAGAGAGA